VTAPIPWVTSVKNSGVRLILILNLPIIQQLLTKITRGRDILHPVLKTTFNNAIIHLHLMKMCVISILTYACVPHLIPTPNGNI